MHIIDLYNINDYAEKIKFQLSGYRKRSYNGVSSYEQVLKTWDQFSEEKLNTHEYRNYLNRSGLACDILEQLDLQGKSREEKIQIIFDYVRTNFHWNYKYRRVPELKIQELRESGEGNSAAINLLLTVLLNEADIEASPALVSTRSYGRVTKNYPLLTQFSHVLCCIHHNDHSCRKL